MTTKEINLVYRYYAITLYQVYNASQTCTRALIRVKWIPSVSINVHSHIFDAVANVAFEPGVVKREEVRVADADLEYLPADLLRSDHEPLYIVSHNLWCSCGMRSTRVTKLSLMASKIFCKIEISASRSNGDKIENFNHNPHRRIRIHKLESFSLVHAIVYQSINYASVISSFL